MVRSERGSILPIGIGVIALSTIFALVIAELIGCQLQTFQAKQFADVLALQVAGDLQRDHISPVLGLDYRPVITDTLNVARRQLDVKPSDVRVVSRDGKTIDATVCIAWKSITGYSAGHLGQLCANSKARAI